ncbi:MAG: FeoB-associated Cys-rich membrane protein [Clostridiales bacterium]|nr:FeoB-associated Cys-rich membrane protein [Clostridiales bacterium]
MATWIVGGVLVAGVVAILWKMISDKRQGKGGCSCGSDCAHCHGSCGLNSH